MDLPDLARISNTWRRRAGFDTFGVMPLPEEPSVRTLAQIVDEVGLYPVEAYHFVEQGLAHAVKRLHGEADPDDPNPGGRHVSGQDLCEGLREMALAQWGLLARTVLKRWNITSTVDFGRIVFALIEGGRMQKTDADSLDDFRNVYDFRTAFEGEYRIEHQS
jgi:uncharacterized repeat protein (TIGR04138 family)